jgi:Membrane-associated sensor domain
MIFPFFLFALAGFGLYASSLYSFLLFHSLIEAVCVVVVLIVFVFAWNSRRFLDNHYFLFLGISFLFSAGFQLVHMFSFKGFGIFPEHDANLPHPAVDRFPVCVQSLIFDRPGIYHATA